jgi:hypothetical protein
VWVANSGGSDVSRLDNNGNFITTIPVGATPTGVAVDSNGKVWVTNYDSHNAMRIDPGTNLVDLTVGLNAGAYPYNYSDMTGAVAVGTTAPQGTWTVTTNGGTPGTPWGTIVWNTEPEGSEPPGTNIAVVARASDNAANLPALPWIPVGNGVPFNMPGQYIEVRATLTPDSQGVSPILSDLTITSDGIPDVEVGGDVYPVNKLSVLAPWIALVAILVFGTILIVNRRRVQS